MESPDLSSRGCYRDYVFRTLKLHNLGYCRIEETRFLAPTQVNFLSVLTLPMQVLSRCQIRPRNNIPKPLLNRGTDTSNISPGVLVPGMGFLSMTLDIPLSSATRVKCMFSAMRHTAGLVAHWIRSLLPTPSCTTGERNGAYIVWGSFYR